VVDEMLEFANARLDYYWPYSDHQMASPSSAGLKVQ
jgi:hypothetical protein